MARLDRDRSKKMVNSVVPGERLRLRDDVYRRMRPREWVFKRMEPDDRLLLVNESGIFGWDVKIDDIDWSAYEANKTQAKR